MDDFRRLDECLWKKQVNVSGGRVRGIPMSDGWMSSKTLNINVVIDLEFVHAKSKCYLKTSIMIIIGEQSSK